MAPMNVSQISNTRRLVKAFATRSLIPLLATEACVEAGRTYQAYKRGGFTEARERLTEEFVSALFWFSGVPLFDKLIDKTVGKGILKLPGDGFDVGKDPARDPLSNYINKNVFVDKKASEKAGKTVYKSAEQVKDLLGNYRTGKLAASLILATTAVGVLVPKVNQAITRKMRGKEQNNEQNNVPQFVPYEVDMDSFLSSKNKDKNVSFGALNGASLMNFVNVYENTPKYQMLTEDGGVLVGRAGNARNKYERIEILFRDGTSCYFYMFNTAVVAKMLNKLEGGPKLDPVSSDVVTKHLLEILGNEKEISVKDFKDAALGKESEVWERRSGKLFERLEESGGRLELDEFLEFFPEFKKHPELLEKAKSMSRLQPQLLVKEAGKTEATAKSILTNTQVDDLLKGGKMNSPEFMHDLYSVNTSEDMLKEFWRTKIRRSKEVVKPAYQEDLSYVALKDLEETKDSVKEYVQYLIKKGEDAGGKITKEMIEGLNNKTLWKQALNWGAGFGVSILFLSTLIPKAQYWITKKLTGSDGFPGVTEYDKKA